MGSDAASHTANRLTNICTKCTLLYMKAISFTEFRKHASTILKDVEQGESVEILRHGTVIARIVPASDDSLPGWKRSREVLAIKGISLSQTIISERRRSET